jgi:TatA/E family protein of Tat protein translocase
LFGIGFTELLIILVFGFLIFGPDKLPKVARTAGHAIGKFRELQKEAKEVVKLDNFIDPDAEDPFGNSVEAAEKLKDVAVRNAKDLKDDALGVASDTKDSLKDRKETLSEKKAEYDAKKKQREKEKAEIADDAASDDSEVKSEENGTNVKTDGSANKPAQEVKTDKKGDGE